MPEPPEYYGILFCMRLTGVSNQYLELRIGPPDALQLRGGRESGLWRVERVLRFAETRQKTPGAFQPVLYRTTVEAARYVGVTRDAFCRIVGKIPPQAQQVGGGKPFDLWSEPFLDLIRKAIASGNIWVRRSSLTRPKMGARVCQPRHVWAADQPQEAEQLKRTSPLDFVIW
jgi:hypothetical protein